MVSYTSLFNESTLGTEDVKKLAVVFSVILFLFCAFSKWCIKEEKRLAWCISILNSALMSVVGVIYLIVKLPSLAVSVSAGTSFRSLHHVDNFCIVVCTWFAVSNAFDILFGLIYYRKYLGILTAYIHHTLYIWLMFFSCTGNGLFVTCRPFASAFVLCTIEEIPTFLLALGSLFKSLRTDLGFGITFALLRLLLHVVLLAIAADPRGRCDTPILVLYGLTLTLHVNWFYGWASKYSSYKAKSDKEKKLE